MTGDLHDPAPTRPVHITYHREPDGWWAESDDLPGFSAAAPTLTDLRRLARDGAAFALHTSHVEILEVVVTSRGAFEVHPGETVIVVEMPPWATPISNTTVGSVRLRDDR
jgi:predicted RNase H-like HicB family nuclease